MKKILLMLVTLVALCASAQNAVGDWRIHTSFVGNAVTNLAEGQEWVYYLSGGNLFRLDKSTLENEAMSISGDLSDMGISDIYYNSGKDYLVVVYDNSNIDVIRSDGSVVNMPEIKNAMMTSSKTVNDVTFAPGLMYLATDFGYVVIDENKMVVKESHLYGEKLVSVAQVGDLLLLNSKTALYYGSADKFYEQLKSFDVATDFQYVNGRIRNINDEDFFCITESTILCKAVPHAGGEVDFDSEILSEKKATVVQDTKGGFLLNIPSLGQVIKTDMNGEIIETINVPGELCSAHPDGNGTLWAAGPQGLHQGSDNFFYPNALSFTQPFWMTYNKDLDLLYVSSMTSGVFTSSVIPMSVNSYDGIRWTNVTPEGAPASGSYWIEFMPGSPDTYFVGSWNEGLYKVVNDKIVFNYNEQNSAIKKRGSSFPVMHPITTVDRYGNVWVVQSYENKDNPVMVLPAAKAKLDQTTAADWTQPDIDNLYTASTRRAVLISTKRGNNDIKLFTDGDFESAVVAWNSAGEVTGRPEQRTFNSFLDQDGQVFSWTNILCMTEDQNGLVWLGCTEGVISFNPAQMFSGDFRVNHIKVPRNDGTGMADYLMSGIQVNDIAIDGANRKWIATQTSGLFLVSADGTQIIKKFNTTNSPLASNTVYRVCCNPNSNSVYATTPSGLYEYFSDSSPAESNYNDIYAYPNPVRPEYGGNVTITGMMDNSLVKIADAGGNVIRQLKSIGGMATWDCCDERGEKAKTGVYFVICSRSNGGSESVVTKIAVIR